MKAKEPLLKSYTNSIIPHLRNYIVDKVENEQDVAVLQQLYAVITPKDSESFCRKIYSSPKTDRTVLCS